MRAADAIAAYAPPPLIRDAAISFTPLSPKIFFAEPLPPLRCRHYFAARREARQSGECRCGCDVIYLPLFARPFSSPLIIFDAATLFVFATPPLIAYAAATMPFAAMFQRQRRCRRR
jgi:hypothetical protein